MNDITRKLLSKIDQELEKLADERLESAGVRQALDELSHAKKCLLTADAMEQSGNSYDRGNSYGYMPMYGGSYDNGMSRNMVRNNRSSYDAGYGRDAMMHHLEDMRNSATSADERARVDRWMREIDNR